MVLVKSFRVGAGVLEEAIVHDFCLLVGRVLTGVAKTKRIVALGGWKDQLILHNHGGTGKQFSAEYAPV